MLNRSRFQRIVKAVIAYDLFNYIAVSLVKKIFILSSDREFNSLMFAINDQLRAGGSYP
jgi:uncharacterized LabA/DUF88 family protein